MSDDPTRAWLRPRLKEAPPELAAGIEALLDSAPGLDLDDPVSALATVALEGLTQVSVGSGERGEALRLLAADAALTYAFEAAAETGRSDELVRRVGLQGELGVQLAGEATAGVRPGPTESP
jgi:hypothetical protein